MSIVGGSVLAVILAISFSLVPATSARPAGDVVILQCFPSYEGNPENPNIRVSASSSSENAPVIESDTDCAQALADLINAGFKIKDVQPADVNGGSGYYTLVR